MIPIYRDKDSKVRGEEKSNHSKIKEFYNKNVVIHVYMVYVIEPSDNVHTHTHIYMYMYLRDTHRLMLTQRHTYRHT